MKIEKKIIEGKETIVFDMNTNEIKIMQKEVELGGFKGIDEYLDLLLIKLDLMENKIN